MNTKLNEKIDEINEMLAKIQVELASMKNKILDEVWEDSWEESWC